MKDNKILIIVAVLLCVIGVSTCFAVGVFSPKEDLEVRIERAGVCNPLKPVEDKSLKISDKEKKKLQKYWEDTDKTKSPSVNELCDCVIGDYKLFVGEDEILYNLDIGYVLYEGNFIDVSDEFHSYLTKVTKDNDIKVEEDKEEESPKINTDPDSSECCSCCPDLKPGESCIAVCCECEY